MKKVILGLMVILLMGVVVAQNSFASTLISPDGQKDTTGNTSNGNAVVGLTEDTSNKDNEDIANKDNEDALILGGSNSDDKNTNNSFSYEDEADEELPQTGLNNTGLVVLTVIALGCAVIAFKRISDYGNI